MPLSGGERTRFMVDAMLGSLARKLRALGFDAAYFKDGTDSELLSRTGSEGRVMLTSDRSLASRARAKGIKVMLLRGKSDGRRVAEIGRGSEAVGVRLVRGDPLCSLCGGELEALGKKDVRGRVPQSVEGRHRLFFRCKSCGHYYWRGTHWKKLRSLANRLGEK
ncbi:MAG: hypothetical protein KGI38_04280 [Thaumarchaeota archaeon]|nr:hypothetical protein [Nitrososphaerota archaeon]